MCMCMGKSVRILYSKYVGTTKQTKSRQVVYSLIGMISFKIKISWRKDIQRMMKKQNKNNDKTMTQQKGTYTYIGGIL